MMRALGAEVILVEQTEGSVPGEVSGADLARVEQRAQQITRERQAFRADQFQLSGNFRAHYLHTAPELWSQSGQSITAFCDFVGSGGSYAGVTRYLKEQDKNIQCFVVEPEGAAAIAGQSVTHPNHRIQGGGYSMPNLKFLHDAPVDGFLQVSAHQAANGARRLAREEGIFAGYSSGANLAAAHDLLQGKLAGHTICIIICDSGLKYLSTELWSDDELTP
jgi:cysteine synthase A